MFYLLWDLLFLLNINLLSDILQRWKDTESIIWMVSLSPSNYLSSLIIKSTYININFLLLPVKLCIYETSLGWNLIARAVSRVSSGCRQVQVVSTRTGSLSSTSFISGTRKPKWQQITQPFRPWSGEGITTQVCRKLIVSWQAICYKQVKMWLFPFFYLF